MTGSYFARAFFCLQYLCIISASGQILDDSTRNVFGTNTTLYVLESDIFNNISQPRKLDTSLVNFHKFDYVRKRDFLYQDLGNNLGTAAKPVFYQLPSAIGVQWGMEPYPIHYFKINDIKYYDTKSPFTEFYFVQGGRGQQIVRLEFSRNITSRWNFGFNYQRLNTFRQYASTGSRQEDAILEQYNASFFMRWQSKKGNYQVLGHFAHFNSPMRELGGILTNTENNRIAEAIKADPIYAYQEAASQLIEPARSWQTKNRYHLYHQYNLDTTRLQVYHTFEFLRQRDSYLDNFIAVGEQFFFYAWQNFRAPPEDEETFDNDTIYDDYKYRLFTNHLGLKGSIGVLQYAAYLKRRDYNLKGGSYDQYYRIDGRSENYIGARIRLALNDTTFLQAEAERWLGNDYLLRGRLSTPFAVAEVQSILHSPSLVQNRYVNNLYSWSNNFKKTFVNELSGQLFLIKNKADRGIDLFPMAKYQIINNYIYFTRFDTLSLKIPPQDLYGKTTPEQSSDVIQIFQLGGQFNLHSGRFHLENTFYFTQELSVVNVIRFPRFFTLHTLYFEGMLFKKALATRIGIDFHFRDGYYMDAYMPLIKQFYVQDNYFVPAYGIVDVFINMRIKKVRAFAKMVHLNQSLLPSPYNGYISTPVYAGMQRTFAFGIQWRLFD